MSVYKDKQDGTYVPNSVGSAFKERTEEDKELIHNLLCHFSKRQNTSSKKVNICLSLHHISDVVQKMETFLWFTSCVKARPV